MEYSISICRDSKQWAVFDDKFNCVKEFQPFTDEKVALQEGKDWVASRSQVEPTVVYPQITSMKMTYSRPRRRK